MLAEIIIRVRDQSEAPLAWDAGFSIYETKRAGRHLQITGSVCGHGIGDVTINCPMDQALELYCVEFSEHGLMIVEEDDHVTLPMMVDWFSKHGYTVVERDPRTGHN